MIKINYKIPENNESLEEIARANIIMSDKFKKNDYLEMSCISWLKINSNRDYQDLEQLLRHLNLDSHVIAHPIKMIPENLEIGLPNENNLIEQFEYVIKISCKPKEDALKELLQIHNSYEDNYDCLKKAGCFKVKKVEPKQEIKEKLDSIKGITDSQKVINCELKLDFTFYKPIESINYIIEDLTNQYKKIPEKIICGEFNENKVYGLMIDGQIISPIGWMEKTNNNILNSNQQIEKDYELIDFRTIKIEKK